MSVQPRKSESRRARRMRNVFEPWLVWRADAYRELSCPACHVSGVMEKRLDASPPFKPRERLSLYECAACGTQFFPDAIPFEYGHSRDSDLARKFYIEIGAGLDAMAAPLHWALTDQGRLPGPGTNYLEVGGGYGFSLDFAVRGLGWSGRSVDPSHIAASGARDLDLDIRPVYLTAQEPLADGPFDRVLASEVIEHVPEPDGFIDAIAAAVKDEGVALLSTPDAAAIRPEAGDSVLKPILAPTHHLILFSEDGLRAALERAGFTHIEIISRDETLLAAASRSPFQADFSAVPDQDMMCAYLRQRRDMITGDALLSGGFGWRLLKACVNADRFDEAEEALSWLSAHWRRHFGLDLTQIDGIDPKFDPPQEKQRRALRRFAANYPFSLPAVLYFAGLVREKAGRRDEALALYRGCIRLTPIFKRAYAAMFTACKETEGLAVRARLHLARLVAHASPEEAVRQILTAAPEADKLDAESWRRAQLDIFSISILGGHLAEGEPLAAQAAQLVEDSVVIDDSARLAAAALGHRALSRRACQRAADWFELAAKAASSPVEAERLSAWARTARRDAQDEMAEASGRRLVEAMGAGDLSAALDPARTLAGFGPDHPGLGASAANAMGLYLLNAEDGLAGAAPAAQWFARARSGMSGAAAREALYHQTLALALSGARSEAEALLRELESQIEAHEDAALRSRMDTLSGYVFQTLGAETGSQT